MRSSKLAFCAALLVAGLHAQTASYPAALATSQNLKVGVNGVSTLLTADVTSGATTLTISSCAGIVPYALVTIDQEIMDVTGCSGTTMIVDVRGFDNTNAVAHVAGSIIYANVDAWHHNSLASEVQAIELALGINLGNVLNQPSTGNAATANALANAPVPCVGGALAGGIDVRGNSINCSTNSLTATTAVTATTATTATTAITASTAASATTATTADTAITVAGTLSDQSVSTPTDLVTLCATAASQGKSLTISRSWDINSSLACNIQASTGGKFRPTSGHTTTLTGAFDGDLTQHFDTSSGGIITTANPFKMAVLYPQWWGAKGDGVTVTDGVCSANSRTVTSASAPFLNRSGQYISIAGAGASTTFPTSYNGGLGSTLSGVASATSATVTAACNSTGVSGATVTVGTDDYVALRNTALSASWAGVGSVVFPRGMYVIGQHKTYAGSATTPSYVGINAVTDIIWLNLSGVSVSGPGASIYIDGSFAQANDNSGFSNENAITPFWFQNAKSVTISDIQIIGNKDLTTRVSGVTGESLTSHGVVFGGTQSVSGEIAGTFSANYSITNVGVITPQTDCFIYGYNSLSLDEGAETNSTTCSQPARGNYTILDANNLHFTHIQGGLAGEGNYGGYQPKFCIDIEPGTVAGHTYGADNIVIDGRSKCSDDIGWELTVIDPTKVGHVTVSDSTFSWKNSDKEQGFNAGAAYSLMDNNTFSVAHKASSNNVLANVGTQADGYINQIWTHNKFIDTTNTYANCSSDIFDSGTLADGSMQNIDVIGNTFQMNGLCVNLRNMRIGSDNHFYWTATGGESSGSNLAVDFEGSQSVHDNDYNTNLAASGKHMTVFYNGGAPWFIPIVNDDLYLNPTFMLPACGYCTASATPSGGYNILALTPPMTDLITNGNFATSAGWTFGSGWSFSTGFAVATSVNGGATTSTAVNIVQGSTYVLVYTVSSYSAGNVLSFMDGGLTGASHNSNGEYQDFFTAVTGGSINVGVEGNTGLSASVTNIHLYKL